jgi:EAL domain-containing protein (putative c-di-GMP-specific phosphodiesterase class I)
MQNEHARLSALKDLRLLDTIPSANFDRITRLAASYFDLPVAAISLTDTDRQWFKSKVGVEHNEIPRYRAPCAQVAETCAPLVIRDFANDDYYSDSTLGHAGIRFYCGVPLVTPDGHGLGALCVLGTDPSDVTDEQLATLSDLAAMVMDQIELQHSLGRIEPSSGLPNRYQLVNDLSDLAKHQESSQQIISLLDLAHTAQLDRMIRVVGVSYLDGLIAKVRRILNRHLGDDGMAYHIAPTQFVFLCPADKSLAEYTIFLNQMMLDLKQEHEFQISMTPSIGSFIFNLGDSNTEEILRSVQSAVQDAREKTEKIAFFSTAMDLQHERNYIVQREFPNALMDSTQLSLAFQPRIDAVTGGFRSAEVLLRWQHPTLGNISPAEFIPIIEASEYARPLTNWVLRTALRQLSAWNATGMRLTLSINLSAINLQEADFIDRLNLMLAEFGIDAHQIEFELTETAMMMQTSSAMELLHALNAKGIRLSIDDFGTGYSSLAYLQKLPVQVVKIDRSFVNDINNSHRERILVQSMIELSHRLGYQVVAEGVETRETADLLAAMKCEELQGYWISRPLTSDAFMTWLGQWSEFGSSPRKLATA